MYVITYLSRQEQVAEDGRACIIYRSRHQLTVLTASMFNNYLGGKAYPGRLQRGLYQSSKMTFGEFGDNGGDRTNGKGNRFRGGPQSQRDQDMKRYPKEFKDWYHRNSKPYKLLGQPDPNLNELIKIG
jgi:hypothetical protein